MNLNDIYNQLSHGELSQLFLGNGGEDRDGISEEDFKKAFPHIVTGLTDLHTRFALRERALNVELQPNQATYVLSLSFAESNVNGSEPVKYIRDAADPFQDDLLKIERITGIYMDDPVSLPTDKVNNLASIRIPEFNKLIVPTDVEMAPWLAQTTILKVAYRADHPKITDYLANASPLSTEIYLSPAYLWALCLFVASRVHTPVGMSQEFHEGNNYAQKYEAECMRLSSYNLDGETEHEQDRIAAHGWV